ncbi:F-box only protein 30-like [Lampris incognitus]|uniref:F-box only protein 30-like n=1 Tax=Lampris incognitus TaxID=2546036 RepID=UPI0024B6204F|nr:F-box only protein 30-like [Lampris incognitus]
MEEHHVHCLSCVNQRCMATPKPGFSCDLINCPLVCGAVFHSCKITEHRLLCPLERVPCLNSGFGCPSTLVRSRMSAHLEVCPAGVVCCTMEWNRWPVSFLDYTSYESLSRGVEEVEQLDMALALQDQRTLLESLKLVAMAPTTEMESLVSKGDKDSAICSTLPVATSAVSTSNSPPQLSSSSQPKPSMACSAKMKIANGINGLSEDHYSKLYEATAETARSLAAALDVFSSANCFDSTECASMGGATAKKEEFHNGPEDSVPVGVDYVAVNKFSEPAVCHGCLSGMEADNGTGQKISDTGNGPLSGAMGPSPEAACAVDGQDNTNTVVPQGPSVFHPATSPLTPPLHVSQGIAQRASHVVLEDRGLVVLEDHGLERKFHSHQLLRGLGQFSLPNGRRGLLPDRSFYRLRPKMEDKAVDTSDLEQEDDPMGLGEIDLITAALLFCLEESRECRRISDTVYVDSYHVDFGTQTFTFPAAILVTNTRVGDMASASACDHAAPQLSYPSPFRTLRLGLVLESLEVEEVPHNRYLPPNPRYQHMFPFVCGQSFRRDQFSSHFTNVHGDIHAGLNGWMEHRCPLAYYGCTFSQRRFHPSTRGAKVVHDRHLRSFGVQPCPGAKFQSVSQSDQLSGLPIEILWHIAGFLDSFSLCQLSMVSRTMRDICASLLQARGIVELQWERMQYPNKHGTVSWQIKNKVWRYSTAFSPVSSWGFSELPSMSNHLRKCRFNTVERKMEPVPLPAMCTARDGHSLRRVLRHINT